MIQKVSDFDLKSILENNLQYFKFPRYTETLFQSTLEKHLAKIKDMELMNILQREKPFGIISIFQINYKYNVITITIRYLFEDGVFNVETVVNHLFNVEDCKIALKYVIQFIYKLGSVSQLLTI